MRIIAGALKGRELRTVTAPGYRPAMARVRESLFSMLESRGVVWGAATVLDLFAGSGSLGFEALSRGAAEAVFVENDPRAAACLKKNAALLGVADKCRIHEADVTRLMARRPEHPYSLVFVDPPYADDTFEPALRNLLRQGWLADDGLLVAELERRRPLKTERDGLTLDTDRLYGQTRILLWRKSASPSIPAPSIP